MPLVILCVPLGFRCFLRGRATHCLIQGCRVPGSCRIVASFVLTSQDCGVAHHLGPVIVSCGVYVWAGICRGCVLKCSDSLCWGEGILWVVSR